jgi:hypothetical protein
MNKHLDKVVARDGTSNNLDSTRNRMQNAKIEKVYSKLENFLLLRNFLLFAWQQLTIF